MHDSALFTTSSARDKHVEGFSPIEKHKVWCRKDQCSVVMKSLGRGLAVLKSNKRWFSRAQKAEEFGGPRSKALLGSVEKKPNTWFRQAEKVKAAVLKKALGVLQSCEQAAIRQFGCAVTFRRHS